MSFFELFDIVAGARRNTVESNNENPINNGNEEGESSQNQDPESQVGSTILSTGQTSLKNSVDKDGSDLVSNDSKMNMTRKASGAKFQLNMNKINRNNSNLSNNGNSPRNNNNNSSNNNNNNINNNNNNNNNNNISGRSNSVLSVSESPRNKIIMDGLIGPSISRDKESEGERGGDGADIVDSETSQSTKGGDNNEKRQKELDYYDEYYTENGELKLFVKPKKWWQLDTMFTTMSYLSKLTLIAILVTTIACIYLTFYVVLGNRFVFDKTKPKWGLATSIIAGVINEQLLVTIAYSVLTSQFGFKNTKCSLPVAILFSAASAAFTTCGRIYGLSGTSDFIPKYFLTLGNIIVVSFIVGYKSFKSKLFCLWVSLPYISMGIILIAYDYFLIKWYIKDSTGEFEKSVVRIVIHPVITAILLLISRFCINQLAYLKPRSIISLMLIPICFNSFYGRLFGNTMDTLQGVVISSLILSLLEIVWKCSLRARDSFIVRFLCRCSGNAAAVMQQNLPLYTEYQSFEMIYDLTSTFVSTYMVCCYFFVFTTNYGSDISKQFKIMAIQLAFSIVTEILVAYVSLAYLKLPIVIPYKKRKDGFLFITCFSFLSVIAFITIRIINLLHDQWIV
ncbi:hypothetical protein RB653_006574 [Dictyostelium firmibasis]|uniref:Uncharacterized protein n=1 Tax=Dictyostelium firmibasis TaxID=79012 RepID=A0AAN7TT60_9MYCE